MDSMEWIGDGRSSYSLRAERGFVGFVGVGEWAMNEVRPGELLKRV